MHFIVRWPDGTEMRCYSPSTIVREYLEVGRSYPLGEFLERSRTMLRIGSERVKARYGYYCTGAMEQLEALETHARGQDRDRPVTVVGFELPPGTGGPRRG
jgi:uncharacterized repeat protein (TIGR04042 family)